MSNIRRQFKKRINEKQDSIIPMPAVIGDDNGNVYDADRNIYVRIAGQVQKIKNSNISPLYNQKVWVGYEPTQPNTFKILNERTSSGEGNVITPAKHAHTHEWMGHGVGGGTDVVKVQLGQFMPLRVMPYSEFKIMIYPGLARVGDHYVLIADTNDAGKPVPKIVDLSDHAFVDTGKEAYVIVTIDINGDIQSAKGDEVTLGTLALTDIPPIPDDTQYVLAAVRFYSGIMRLQENREAKDIVDLRFPMAHIHPLEEIAEIAWNAITGKPTEFPPEEHTHVGADILDLYVYTGRIGDIPVNMISPSAGDLLVINSGSAESLFDPDNLVKDGSVSPANLFDGNKTNQWVSTEAKNWAAFDFEYSAYVSKIVITANAGDWMWADFPNDIYIWGSHTGTFTGEETEMDHYAPTATGVYTREFSEPRTAYRYYKIDFGRPSHGCRVNELEIYVVSAPTRFENRKLVEADITDLDHDAVKIDGITVDLTGISDGEALVYDSTGTKIIPGSGGGGASAMSGLSDVDLTGLADDDILVYDSTSSKWLPEAKPAGGGEGGGTSGDWLEFIDGALVVETGVGGTYIVPRDSTIEAVMIHCKDQGSTGSTIVDVNLNGTTIFTTQSGRPELAYDDVDGVATSGTPDIVTLVAGDILTIDIDQIATGAESLSVLVAMHTTITLGSMSNLSDVDLTGIVDGNVLVYDGTSSKFIAGEGGGTGGADILEVQVFM